MENKWRGFDCEKFQFEEHDAIIVYPKENTKNGYLAVKCEYWDAFPEAAEIPMLELGFHLCFIKNENRFAMDYDLDRKARFIKYVANKCGLSEKCVPVGMSCGGLITIKFAAKYPELISCIYIDAPVVNYMSWPIGAGKVRNNFSHEVLETWKNEAIGALGVSTIGEVLAYRDMPLDNLQKLIANKIPAVMVSGDSDKTVPFDENGIFVQKAYKDAGLDMEVYIKPGGDHHPHGLPDPKPVIDFILKYCN